MSDLSDRVLIVDDEALIAEVLRMHVENMGMEVCATAATASAAIALAEEHRPSVVLMDVRLRGEKDGVDAAIAIHQTVGSKVIFITGSNEQTTRSRIQEDHPTAVLFKPFSVRQLQTALQSALGDARG